MYTRGSPTKISKIIHGEDQGWKRRESWIMNNDGWISRSRDIFVLKPLESCIMRFNKESWVFENDWIMSCSTQNAAIMNPESQMPPLPFPKDEVLLCWDTLFKVQGPSMEMTTFSVTKISLARCFASIYFSLKSGTTFQPLFGRVTHDSCVTDPNGDWEGAEDESWSLTFSQ